MNKTETETEQKEREKLKYTVHANIIVEMQKIIGRYRKGGIKGEDGIEVE